MSATTELACRLCGDVVVWARGVRWVRPQGRLVDQRHLIRADNGLHSDVCPRSDASDPVHEIDDRPALCSFALDSGRYCRRPAGHERTDGRLPLHDSSDITALQA